MSPLERAWGAFASLHDGTRDWQRGDRALTLHMLQRLAPRFFERRKLAVALTSALEALAQVPGDFPPSLDLDAAMSRVDAIYLRWLHGYPVTVDAEPLVDYIVAARAKFGLLPAWLMGEQSARFGVAARLRLPERYPFASQNWAWHLYHLTHWVMLDSDYFHRRPAVEGLAEELAQLERSLSPLINARAWDLLAEVGICLAACGRPKPDLRQALLGAQRRDGSWSESGQDLRQRAHTTAACLLAVASVGPSG